jgi:signal transduction histidine kinase/CheY-like chemotaxis protein
MAIGFTTLLSLSADAILTILGLALAFLVIWQDARRRSNQHFSLCMIVFALYGALSCPFKVAQIYDLDAEFLLNSLTTLYIIGFSLLLSFLLAFAGLSSRARWIERAIRLPLAGALILLTWTNQIYTHLEPMSDGGYRYGVTDVSRGAVVLTGLYLLAVIAILYRQRTPQARELFLSVSILPFGLLGFVLLSGFRVYEANVLVVTITVVMVGRLVLKYQVFNPLEDLNSALEITNLELAEATRLKSQFLANMSHELRTPLNSILGYTELITNGTYGSLTDTQRDRLEKVTRNGRRLLDLINDVLDLSRIEAGRLDLRPQRVETGPLLDALLTEAEPLAQAKGLALVHGYAELPAIRADEARAHQILWNVITNAIKFTEKGTVSLRGYCAAESGQVVFSVTDTGPGIAPSEREHIFEAFHQADESPYQRHEGTRLGLALARLLVQMQQGRIWFESAVGKGSTFFIALPVADEKPPVAPVLKPGPRARGPVLLAIDPNREALEVLQAQLEQAGFQVYGTSAANEGLHLAHDLKPALIALEVRMLDLPGEQVIASLRNDPVTAQIPVLVVSTTTADQHPLKVAGASGFVTKPAPVNVLVEQIHRLLAQAAPEQPVLTQEARR